MSFGALLGSASNTGAATGTTLAVGPLTVAKGDLCVFTFSDQSGIASVTVADDLGNVWTAAPAADAANRLYGWHSVITTGGSMTITATFGSTGNDRVGVIGRYEGPWVAVPIDKSPTSVDDAAGPPAAGPSTGTLSQAAELVCGHATGRATAGTMSAVAPFTTVLSADAGNCSGAQSYLVVSATTAQQPSFDYSGVSAADVGATSYLKAPVPWQYVYMQARQRSAVR